MLSGFSRELQLIIIKMTTKTNRSAQQSFVNVCGLMKTLDFILSVAYIVNMQLYMEVY